MVVVFIAEMGDKTQFVAVALATRYRASLVLAAICVSTSLVHFFSVLLGQAAGRMLPGPWINIMAGIAFIGFGIWTLRGDNSSTEEPTNMRAFGTFLAIVVSCCIAEIGDKTMLATITVASQHQEAIQVWLGSVVGMVCADGLAIALAKSIGRQLPARVVKTSAACVFLLSGATSLIAH